MLFLFSATDSSLFSSKHLEVLIATRMVVNLILVFLDSYTRVEGSFIFEVSYQRDIINKRTADVQPAYFSAQIQGSWFSVCRSEITNSVFISPVYKNDS